MATPRRSTEAILGGLGLGIGLLSAIGLFYVSQRKTEREKLDELFNGKKCCAEESAAYVKSKIGDRQPKIAIVCGSGLGSLANEIKNAVTLSYEDIPNFPTSTVKGHHGSLVIGTLEGVEVCCLRGRIHLYEGIDPRKIRVLIYTFKLLGCEQMICTSATGSTNKEFGPGTCHLLRDHINSQGVNPLVGRNDPIGPRFIGMKDPYDAELRQTVKECAANIGITLGEGVYHACIGPCFESPAEVKSFAKSGADFLGMSTVGEVMCARHCDMKVIGLTVVVNYACAFDEIEPSHAETLAFAAKATPDCIAVVMEYLSHYSQENGAAAPSNKADQ